MNVRRFRLVAVATATVLVVAGGLVVRGLGSVAGAHSNPCTKRLATSLAHERMISGSGRHVAVIGDSYSIGLELRPDQQPWPSRLPGRVQVFGYSGSGFSRDAGGCRRSSYSARAPGVLRTRPALIVVEGGLNDYDTSDAAARAGYRRLMAELGRTRTLVVGPAPAPARLDGALRVDALLRAETRRTRTPYLSMIHRRFDYFPDGVHLTAESQRTFGELVAAALRRHPPRMNGRVSPNPPWSRGDHLHDYSPRRTPGAADEPRSAGGFHAG